MTTIIAATIATALHCGIARAECFKWDDSEVHTTMHGQIVQDMFATDDELGGRKAGTKFMAIVPDEATCVDEPNSEPPGPVSPITIIEVDVPKKWLGHHVTVTGTITFEGMLMHVEHIEDKAQ